MAKSRGVRSRTRTKLATNLRHKFKISSILKKFKIDDRVIISINPSIHDGMPHPRFQGHHGIICEKKGRCYGVKIKDMGKEKKVYVHPAHLKVIK